MAKPSRRRPSAASPLHIDGLSWLESESVAATYDFTDGLNESTLAQVARDRRPVRLSKHALTRLTDGRAALESVLSDGQPHYGINTGFGSFSRQRIPAADLRDLQRNLIRSHAAGVGEPLPTDVVRGMMVLLIASLSRGHSGVRPKVVQTLVDMLNKGVHPIVPSVGSCGASGDLAPLAHVILVAIGEGQAEHRGRTIAGGKALKAAAIKPIALEAKEGLALINGTHLMAAQAALIVHDLEPLFDAALVAAAMSIDACRATDAFLDERVHRLRGQEGQFVVAERLRDLLAGSQILPSHRLNDPRVQDPYSLRCAPQVLGAVLQAMWYLEGIVANELGAVTDNPLIFPSVASSRSGGRRSVASPDVVSAGNFHGMALALPLDTIAIALSHLGGIAERRIYHMLSGFDPETGLPPFLSPGPGLHSGLMIAQYTAAACCNELIGLATPASVANLSTSAGMEDYNSWGPRSAAKARRALELARNVVAIELLSASEALEHHRPLKSSKPVEEAHKLIRSRVPRLTADRPPAPDIAAIAELIGNGSFSS
jgi:histidine ammonia-lyase